MSDETTKKSTGGKPGRFFLWIIMGLLIVGLMGFGATGLSGNIRTIGSVGDKPITTQSYFNALNQEINAVERQIGRQLSFPEAQSFGLDQRALQRLVLQRALDQEATTQGLSIGDERVREQVLQIPAFRGLDGGFDRSAYAQALSHNGQSERDFEDSLREDAARTLLQAAVITGFEVPESYIGAIMSFAAERRNFTWARVSATDLVSPIAAPTDADLQAFYEANPILFTRPEARNITYAWLTPTMMLDEVEVDEALLRDRYDELSDQYNQPERRLVERLVFGSSADAETALAEINSGATTFEAVVEARGLRLEDIDLGDVARSDLSSEAAELVFATEDLVVVGPAQSSLGPALYRINGVLAEQSVSFEEAREELRELLAQDAARRQVEASREAIDDLLAGGAEVDELAAEGMEVGSILWHAEVEDGIAAYEAFRAQAALATADDFPELYELEDGGVFALRLDDIVPPTLRPFEEVRDAVADAWQADQELAALRTLAETLLPQVETGTEMSALGLNATVEVNMTRTDFVPDTPPGFLPEIFQMSPGDVTLVEDATSVLIVRLDDVLDPDTSDPTVVAMREALTQDLSSSFAQDAFEGFSRAVQSSVGLNLNQQAINAVHTQIQ